MPSLKNKEKNERGGRFDKLQLVTKAALLDRRPIDVMEQE